MSIYATIRQAIGTFLTEKGFTCYAERAQLSSAPANRRMCVISVVSDTDMHHADNKPRARRYRLQLDLMCPQADESELFEWFEACETALVASGAFPQGNYRFSFDDDAELSYIQKDYIYYVSKTDQED